MVHWQIYGRIALVLFLMVATRAEMPLSTAPAGARLDLIESAKKGDAASVEALLASGVAVAPTDPLGRTPLHYAARLGHIAVIELLLKKGAPVDATDKAGFTPLVRAVQAGDGNLRTVQLLLSHGADPSRIVEGKAPLDWARDVNATAIAAALAGRSSP
jgi:ankyrin repeat protein